MEDKIIKPRIVSLDMFRGFAIFGMILVNYLGHFDVIHETFKHPRYGMTFANAIAPYFLFAVGMGLKMSLQRRIKKVGARKAYLHAIKRYIILIIIGIVVYGPDPKMDMWDALVDIGFAGLIVLPFIATSLRTRMIMAFVLLAIYQLLFMYTGYGEWTMPNSIDGGPLGPISWAAILVFGTIQMDYLEKYTGKLFITKSLILGVPLMMIGLALSYLQPSELWEFSQRSMTVAYPLFASGLSIVTYALFYLLGDLWKINIPHLKVLGYNPLIIYILQQILIEFYGGYLPRTALLWQAILGFVVIYGLCYLVARYLDRNKLIVKI
jgi:predicted acyltransferase